MGFDHADVALAVVVQAMAPADVAGVMFTANPVSGRHDELLISAGYGLGESVVSGSITPDTFVLAPDGTLRARTLGTKAQRSVPDGNGTRTEPVPDAWQARFCLGDQDLAALAGLARRVAAHYGTPQDTEWALGGGTLYLLQARPITTLSAEPVVPSTPDEAAAGVLARAAHAAGSRVLPRCQRRHQYAPAPLRSAACARVARAGRAA
jgi:pyruvate,water dikinase